MLSLGLDGRRLSVDGRRSTRHAETEQTDRDVPRPAATHGYCVVGIYRASVYCYLLLVCDASSPSMSTTYDETG